MAKDECAALQLVEAGVSWRLPKSQRNVIGQVVKCAPTMLSLETPLTDGVSSDTELKLLRTPEVNQRLTGHQLCLWLLNDTVDCNDAALATAAAMSLLTCSLSLLLQQACSHIPLGEATIQTCWQWHRDGYPVAHAQQQLQQHQQTLLTVSASGVTAHAHKHSPSHCRHYGCHPAGPHATV